MKTPKAGILTALLLLLTTAGGCGQKGPLYYEPNPGEIAQPQIPEDEEPPEQQNPEHRNDTRPAIVY